MIHSFNRLESVTLRHHIRASNEAHDPDKQRHVPFLSTLISTNIICDSPSHALYHHTAKQAIDRSSLATVACAPSVTIEPVPVVHVEYGYLAYAWETTLHGSKTILYLLYILNRSWAMAGT